MKHICPRCQAENDSETAQAGSICCVQCQKWFSEKGYLPWSPEQSAAAKAQPAPGGNSGLLIWPAVLALIMLVGILGIIPLLWTALLALFAILGSIITFLAQKK